MGRSWMTAITVAVATSPACIAGHTAGFPLYPHTGEPLDATRIARLTGYVRYVDSQDVSRLGTVFDLLPGCHVIKTPTSWGRSEYNSGAIVGSTPEITFALPMQAGHQYSIQLISQTPAGETVPFYVKAFERDVRGELLQTFGPAQSARDVDLCASSAAQVAPVAPASDAQRPNAEPAPVAVSPPPERAATEPSAAVAAASSEPVPPLPWPEPPTPTSGRSLDEAIAHSDALIAHWKRVPEYHSHFDPAGAQVSPASGVAFAHYIVRVQTAVMSAFANCASRSWRAASADQPRSLQVELVLDPKGALRDVGVIASSGSEWFDAAALEGMARAAPFGPTPESIRSADGFVYARWWLSNDPSYGCVLSTRRDR